MTQSQQDKELLPCPFCGSTDIDYDNCDHGSGQWYFCNGCGISMKVSYQHDIRKTWNRRAPLSSTRQYKESPFAAIGRIPELQSCLYDLNLLPEVLATFNQGTKSKEYFYMITVIAHFVLMEERASLANTQNAELVSALRLAESKIALLNSKIPSYEHPECLGFIEQALSIPASKPREVGGDEVARIANIIGVANDDIAMGMLPRGTDEAVYIAKRVLSAMNIPQPTAGLISAAKKVTDYLEVLYKAGNPHAGIACDDLSRAISECVSLPTPPKSEGVE